MGKQKKNGRYLTPYQSGELSVEYGMGDFGTDMFYHFKGYEKELDEYGNKVPIYSTRAYETKKSDMDIETWSITALLGLLPDLLFEDCKLEIFKEETKWCVRYVERNKRRMKIVHEYKAKLLIDAAFYMVRRLRINYEESFPWQ